MSTEIAKVYDPNVVEEGWQEAWTQAGCFRGDPGSAKPGYSIVIPPPNVTGILHLGHVLNNTLQDIMARRSRQEGKEVCWLPGTDHAGIATQVKVEKQLREQTGQSKLEVGREAFLERVWEWKEKHGGIIVNQLKRLGCSCDWERERFTLDEGYSEWVLEVFAQLFDEGLIYRGRRMVNWCPVSLTALSDEEVIMTPQRGKLYTMRYELVGQEGQEGRFLEIATTRPETLMADAAVAVHPEDARYKDLIGGSVWRPFPREEIPIIADEHIDPEFGTGVLKVTPAHDVADWEIGLKNDLVVRDVLTADGHVNCPEVERLHGMERFRARKEAGRMLEELDLLVSAEDYENSVGFSERAGVPIEPRLSMQWFLKYPAVEEAMRVVAEGEVEMKPERWRKSYLHWMENIQDWCISRQLWWGHRIPVWYRKDVANELKERQLSVEDAREGLIHVGTRPPEDGENWVQDEDVLDTWFSSWLWPFATMADHGEEDSAMLAKFYPTADLVTGPDILFFWVARMIMAGLHFRDEKPFSHVFFTSIIRDLKGRKMSKSLGNSPDPLELMAEYGADGLRFGLLRIAPTGTDVRFDVKSVEEGRNFATKLWNACRLRQMVGKPTATCLPDVAALPPQHVDILARVDGLALELERALGAYRFNDACSALYEFFWSNYCDLFLEAVKGDLRGDADPSSRAVTCAVMDVVMSRFLPLLHPFMPHLTEELALRLGLVQEGEFLMNRQLEEEPVLAAADAEVVRTAQARAADLYESAGRLRNLKAEYGQAANKGISFVLKARDCALDLEILALLANSAAVELDADFGAPTGTPVTVTPLGEVFMPLEGHIDVEAERARLQKEIGKVEKELARSEKKLGNEKFVANAKPEVVELERQRLEEWREKLGQYRALFEALG